MVRPEADAGFRSHSGAGTEAVKPAARPGWPGFTHHNLWLHARLCESFDLWLEASRSVGIRRKEAEACLAGALKAGALWGMEEGGQGTSAHPWMRWLVFGACFQDDCIRRCFLLKCSVASVIQSNDP